MGILRYILKCSSKTAISLIAVTLSVVYLLEHHWTLHKYKLEKKNGITLQHFTTVNQVNKLKYENKLLVTDLQNGTTINNQKGSTLKLGTKENPLDPAYIQELDKHIMDPDNKLTIPFLENYKNPCWFSKVTGNVSNMYEENPLQYLRTDDKKWWFTGLSEVRKELVENNAKYQIRCLPQLYYIGVYKCGSTDIFFKLLKHPQVFLGKKKEYHWWNGLRDGKHLGGGMKRVVSFSDYIESFDAAARSIRMECPSVKKDDDYHPCITLDGGVKLFSQPPLHQKDLHDKPFIPPNEMIPAMMYKILPNVKLLVSLREPVARCYSEFFYFNKNHTKDPKKFHAEAVLSLELMQNCIAEQGSRNCAYNQTLHNEMKVHLYASMYYIFMRDWLTTWPRKQMLVLELKEFSANRTKGLDELTDFLQLDRFPTDLSAKLEAKPPSNYNPASEGGKIWPETKKLLGDFFQPYNDMLAGILGDEKYRWK